MRSRRHHSTWFLAIVLGLFLVTKMVLFEPFYPGVSGLYLHAAAILLPFGILFGWPGVVALALGCGIGHLVLPDSLGILDGLGAGTTVLISGALGLKVARKGDGAIPIFAGAVVLTFGVSLGFGTYQAMLVGEDVPQTILRVFRNVWIAIVLVGFPLMLLMRRGMIRLGA